VKLLKRITVTAAGAALATGLMASAASAATHNIGPWPDASAVTYVTTTNVQGGGGSWASSTVWRTASVSFGLGLPAAPWHCGWTGVGPPPSCFAFSATVRDSGSFTTHRFALTPNQGSPYTGRHIRSVVSGSVSGLLYFGTFYATTFPSSALVSRFYLDIYGFSAFSWPRQFFPVGTTFGLSPSFWGYTYSAWTRCGFQQWTTQSFDHGQFAFDGNITGCSFHHH